MKKTMIMSLCVIVAMTLLYWAPEAGAWINYDDDGYGGCKDCHGDYRSSPYTSLTDNISWGDDLHDIHRRNMLGGDCNTCHSGSSRYPVRLDSSNGGSAGDNAMSCLNCHGRIEDANPGAGLRQHHWNAGETGCLDCHDDSDPSNYTPVGEDVLPPFYYFNSSFPSKPSDPCNPNPEYPEDYAGSTSGLDNDGDGLYDGNDPDCSTGPVCTDNDGDTFSVEGDICGPIDCNDSNPSIKPNSDEVCDGIDNNCDGNIDEGFAGNVEMCDGIDNNCDGQTDEGCDCTDNTTRPCGSNTGECSPGTEICVSGQWSNCSGAVGPAPETCDGKDNNCDGRIDDGVTNACGTCGAVPAEICDGIDNDCDGTTDEGVTNACGSCGAVPTEVCGDGIDQDCDGSDIECADPNDVDDDADGYTENQGDCDDNNAPINPDAIEICGNNVDENCDGVDDICPIADVQLNSVKAPKTLRLGKRIVSKRILAFGSADIKVQQADVQLSMTPLSTDTLTVTIPPESISKAVPTEGRPAKYVLKADIQCKASGEHIIEWSASISAPENRYLNNDTATATTTVICR